jgi:hypothetical protein
MSRVFLPKLKRQFRWYDHLKNSSVREIEPAVDLRAILARKSVALTADRRSRRVVVLRRGGSRLLKIGLAVG